PTDGPRSGAAGPRRPAPAAPPTRPAARCRGAPPPTRRRAAPARRGREAPRRGAAARPARPGRSPGSAPRAAAAGERPPAADRRRRERLARVTWPHGTRARARSHANPASAVGGVGPAAGGRHLIGLGAAQGVGAAVRAGMGFERTPLIHRQRAGERPEPLAVLTR